MTAALPYGADTVFRWDSPSGAVVARPIGAVSMGGGSRCVLMDTAEAYYVAEIDAAKAAKILSGPIDGGRALALAEAILTGTCVAQSVTAQMNTLAVALIAQTVLGQTARAA